MGVEYIGWRDCSLQRELGPEGFQAKLELRAYRSVIEARVPEDRRDAVRLRVEVPGGPVRDLGYDEIVRDLGGFEAGIPDCAACPLADGRPLGCYRHVTYPIDASFERLLFECFTSRVGDEGSAARSVYEGVIAARPRAPGPWHRLRGPGVGSLTEMVEPLRHEWTDAAGRHVVDSATLCDALFTSASDPELVFQNARFWNELFAWLDVTIASDMEAGEPGPPALESRTLREIQHVSDLLNASVDRARSEGWRVLVEA